MSGFLKVEQLAKAYQADKPVFADVSFAIDQGEFVCIIGHSGCGKTTILNVLAGLDTATSGHCFMDGREIAGPSLERGVVFQSHALMPWLTVRQNIAFAVKSRWPEWSKAQIAEQVEKYVAMVGLTPAIDKKPSQLSGGMKQRVGIARAFAIQPKMLLLDEPFGALDALTRGSIQEELMGIVRQTQQTVFMITHDVDEAILLADRILLMTNGQELDGGATHPAAWPRWWSTRCRAAARGRSCTTWMATTTCATTSWIFWSRARKRADPPRRLRGVTPQGAALAARRSRFRGALG